MIDSNLAGRYSGIAVQRIILIGIIFAVYGVSLTNGFVYDDKIYFINNPVYRDFNLRAIFLSLANHVEYLPIRDLTYALDYLVWGDNPFGFHFTNLVIFAGNILLVHCLAQLIVKRFSIVSERSFSGFVPFAIAAAFAIHPINAEVVNFVTCRNVLVSGFFFFLACICIIRFFEEDVAFASRWYMASLLAFICAMFGKSTAIMLPILLLALLPVIFPGCHKRVIVSIAPFFAVAVIFFLAFKRIADNAGFTDAKVSELNLFSLERKIVLALQIPFFYLKKLVMPYGYSVEYEAAFGARLLSIQVILAIAAILAIVILAIQFRRRLPELAVGVFWYIAALIPVLNFFGTYPVVADRYAYLPTFGFILLAASFLDELTHIRLKILVTASICLFLAGGSIVRSLDWRSNETLWRANIRNFPNNTKSYVNLASYYYSNGEHQRALDLLSSNIKVPFLNIYSYFFKGQYLFEQNRLTEAKEQFQYTVDNISNGLIGALYFLGQIAEREGDFMSAVYYYNKALVSQEMDDFLFLPRVRARMKDLQMGWLDQYLSSIRKGVAQNQGDLAARKELALTLDRLGFYKEALEQYLALEQGGVKGWQIYQNIANCYYNMNRSSDAVLNYKKVIALGGVSEDAYNNLGVSYRKLQQHDNAIKLLEEGVRLFPGASFPAYNLALTYYDAGMKEKALNSFEEANKKFPDLKDKIAPYIMELSNSR